MVLGDTHCPCPCLWLPHPDASGPPPDPAAMVLLPGQQAWTEPSEAVAGSDLPGRGVHTEHRPVHVLRHSGACPVRPLLWLQDSTCPFYRQGRRA